MALCRHRYVLGPDEKHYTSLMTNGDIDEKNMHYAKQNILKNNLKSRIRPLQTKPTDPLIPLKAFGLNRWLHSSVLYL